jgi:hypothetical protein
MKQAGFAALAVAGALIVAGAALASTPAQYRRQATVICKATSVNLKKIPNPTTPKGFGRYLKQATPIFATQYHALQKLTPPASLSVWHRKALASERAQLVGIRALIAALDKSPNPAATFNAFDKKLSKFSDAEDAAWTKLRVPVCRSVGS